METQDFTTAFLVDQTPAEAFDAINNVRGWWTGEIEGDATKLNDEFTYRYKELHYSKHKLIEVVPNKNVVWLVTDSQLNFIHDKSEWTGSKIIFDITGKDGKTQVRFTHEGLVPNVECFNACSNAWSGLINNNLRNLITSGEVQHVPLEG